MRAAILHTVATCAYVLALALLSSAPASDWTTIRQRNATLGCDSSVRTSHNLRSAKKLKGLAVRVNSMTYYD